MLKWSLTALLAYLESAGIDTAPVLASVRDLVIRVRLPPLLAAAARAAHGLPFQIEGRRRTHAHRLAPALRVAVARIVCLVLRLTRGEWVRAGGRAGGRAQTLLTVESSINANMQQHVPHRSNCYELFGFDVMLDACLHPWLIEVNSSPSLATDAPLDKSIKTALVTDMFNMIGVCTYNRASVREAREAEAGSRLQATAPGGGAARSEDKVPGSERMRRVEVCRGKLNAVADVRTLPPADIDVLRESEEELQLAGGFARIFPTAETQVYGGLVAVRYLNQLLLHFLQRYGTRPVDQVPCPPRPAHRPRRAERAEQAACWRLLPAPVCRWWAPDREIAPRAPPAALEREDRGPSPPHRAPRPPPEPKAMQWFACVDVLTASARKQVLANPNISGSMQGARGWEARKPRGAGSPVKTDRDRGRDRGRGREGRSADTRQPRHGAGSSKVGAGNNLRALVSRSRSQDGASSSRHAPPHRLMRKMSSPQRAAGGQGTGRRARQPSPSPCSAADRRSIDGRAAAGGGGGGGGASALTGSLLQVPVL